MRRPNRGRSAALDRLLDGDVADGTALAEVLAAARAPGSADELAGLSGAMSAFVTATRQLPRPPVGHRAAPRRALTAGGLLAKTVAAVGGVALAGGVAYAATTAGFIGIGGGSHHPPAFHTTTPGHSGEHDRNTGSSPFGSTGPGSAANPNALTTAKTTAAPSSRAVENPGSKPEPDPTHPAHPTQSVHPTHPPSPTHPAPSSSATPPAHGRTSHPTHPPTPSHPAAVTHSPQPKA
jgi:hypothetical protein